MQVNTQEIEMAIDKYGDVVLSKNSNNNVIIMSIEEYKQKIINEEIERKLLKSEEDYKNGRVKDLKDVIKEWKLKYGI